jgi:hypothetical protein
MSFRFPTFVLNETAAEVFTPRSFEGVSQHGFDFRPTVAPGKLKVWARLVEKRDQRRNFNFSYGLKVALWPEGAEAGCVSFVGVSPDDFRKSGENKPEINWQKWQHRFVGSNYFGHLGRYWKVCEGGQTTLLRVDASDAAFVGEEDSGNRFFWRQNPESRRLKDWHWLQMSSAEFESQMRELWNNPESRLRFEVNWHHLSDDARDALAFRCENGSWDEFIRLLRLALIARVGLERGEVLGEVSWQVFCYAPVSVSLGGNHIWPDDPFLAAWRAALFSFFRPVFARVQGFDEDIYDCIKSHFFSSRPANWVRAQPSHHEMLEAQLELQYWAKRNASEERNAELLKDL